MPGVHSDVPVLYWVTDSNPARGLQIKTFHEWLAKNHYPKFEMRVDTANADFSKRLIQSVSGVASDVLDHTGSGTMYFYQEMSLLEDVTEWGKELNFGPDQTYPAIVPEITVDGRQYAFPSNVFAHMYWANRATFRKYGMDVPPARWTFEEFERIGKEFVKRANEGKKRQDVFFVDSINTRPMMRSLGVDVFNETLTRCAVNDPRAIEALELAMKWMTVDHILPSSAASTRNWRSTSSHTWRAKTTT
jgi:multiple sugar transport system substrate-binding protein